MSMSFIGQFHPLIIHLPIGILISGIGLYWYDIFTKENKLKSGIEILTLFAAIAGMISVLTGLILSEINQYDHDLLLRHQYSGIILTIFIVAFYISLKSKKSNEFIRKSLSIINFLLLIVTGHFGGTITHGELNLEITSQKKIYQNNFSDSISIFSSMIQPILEDKCISCHGKEKQKGNLRLDTYENIVTGGKTGHTIDEYEQNIIIKRMILSLDDKKHMPPKERTQLTSEESNIIHWWIRYGASKTIKISEASLNDTIIAFIKSKQPKKNELNSIPPVDQKTIDDFSKTGAVVFPIEKNSALLYLNLQNANLENSSFLKKLSIMSPNIVELKIPYKKISEEILKTIYQMKRLEKLDFSGSLFDDNLSQNILLPESVQTLNLSNVNIKNNDFKKLTVGKNLKKIYVYNLSVDSAILLDLKNRLNIDIMVGKSIVPTYLSDTTFLK